ncbi:MAG: tRNA pseudouridine(13) synthase TruD [Pseudomonadota bacterium]
MSEPILAQIPLTPGPCPSPWGEPVAIARLKAQPEDFVVEEQLGFEPTGEGEHLWLWVEKRGMNTDALSRELAAQLGVSAALVSFSGMKDLQALTRQWFSVHSTALWTLGEDWLSAEGGQYRVLRGERAARKLRRGAHAANRFCITLRDVRGEPEVIEARLHLMAAQGVANYFGPQRFGHGARNILQGLNLLAQRRAGRARRRDNRESLLLSALRSALFNQVLAARVEQRSWASVLPGDVLQLDGRSALFKPDPLDIEIAPRLARGELHPTGPLPGEGVSVIDDAVLALETRVLAPWQSVCADLAALRLPAQRRALRLLLQAPSWHWPSPDTLVIEFTLTAGAFATSVLQALAVLEEGQLDAISAE